MQSPNWIAPLSPAILSRLQIQIRNQKVLNLTYNPIEDLYQGRTMDGGAVSISRPGILKYFPK